MNNFEYPYVVYNGELWKYDANFHRLVHQSKTCVIKFDDIDDEGIKRMITQIRIYQNNLVPRAVDSFIIINENINEGSLSDNKREDAGRP